MPLALVALANLFLSTPSARRATRAFLCHHCGFQISIHALREEGDLHARLRLIGSCLISIHALREEGDRQQPAGR